jgi:hypothetical protein
VNHWPYVIRYLQENPLMSHAERKRRSATDLV